MNLAITKTGRINFEQPIKASRISLNCITMYLNIYNITETATYKKTASSKAITIKPGYYTYENLQKLIPGDFIFDEQTLKVKIDGVITGRLKKLIDNDFLYLTPLCLYVYVDGIDTSKNYLDGKRSSLLSIVPVGKADVKEIFKYQPIDHFKHMNIGEINHLTVDIKDEDGNKYQGKFIAELSLL